MPLFAGKAKHPCALFGLATSYAICESRDGEMVLRELRLDKATPTTFDFGQLLAVCEFFLPDEA